MATPPRTGARNWLGSWRGARQVLLRRRPALEVLEGRFVPSGIAPTYIPYRPAGGEFHPAGSPTPLSSSFTPVQIAEAYAINTVSFNGIVGNGAGQTIAIIDAYDDPDLVSSSASGFSTSDLHTFDVQFGLPEPTGFFSKVSQTGGTNYPKVDRSGDWEGEEALDVEWAHAIAPMAHIILVEAKAANNNLYTALQWAEDQSAVSVISMSWGGSEASGETSDDSYFQTPSGHHGITFIASTGDNAAPGEYPAFSPNVVAVGGTSLYLNSNGTYSSETGWSDSGGGKSTVEPEPTYQESVQSSGAREIPDIAFDADPGTGVAVCDAYNYGSTTPWAQFGGTSVGAPCWAGLIAIADQGRAVNGFTTLDGATQTLPLLYSAPASDIHDITTGNNGFAAGPGYDMVTGLGTPIANLLLPALAGSTNTTLTTSANPVAAGQSFTLAATVIGGGAVAAPTGTVTFMDGSSALGSETLNAAGQATFVVNGLAAGTHPLTAVYGGDSANGGSTSAVLDEVVDYVTSTTLTDNGPSVSNLNVPVSFTATVSGGSAITGETVSIEDAANGNAVVATPTLTNGTVTFTISNLAVGSHELFAVYAGDSTDTASQSGAVPQTVLPAVALSSVLINVGTAPIVGISVSGNLVTVTTAGNTTFPAGQPLLIANTGVPADNGSYFVYGAGASNDSDTFAYVDDNPGVADADVGGTVTVVGGTGSLGNGSLDSGTIASQRSMVDAIVYTFNQPVTLGSSAFNLAVHSGQLGTLPANVNCASPDGGTTWVLTFSGANVTGNSIDDGVYDITLSASAVTGAGTGTLGASETDTFWRLFGDSVGHETVSGRPDFQGMQATLGSSTGSANYLALYDFNADGAIAGRPDFSAIQSRLGTTYGGFTATI